MNGPTPSNAELANFFRCHSKNSKLSKEEFEHIDSLLFGRSFPLTAPPCGPFTWNPTSSTSKFSSTSDFTQRSSRKKLDFFESGELKVSKPLFNFETAPSEPFSLMQKPVGLEFFEKPREDDSVKITKVESNLADTSKTPRKMTDAAKELMASIQMFVDASTDEQEDEVMNSNDQHQTIPAFKFEIPVKKLPEFHFDISESKPEPVKPLFSKEQPRKQQDEYKFEFDLSGFSESKQTTNNYSNAILPHFNFELD